MLMYSDVKFRCLLICLDFISVLIMCFDFTTALICLNFIYVCSNLLFSSSMFKLPSYYSSNITLHSYLIIFSHFKRHPSFEYGRTEIPPIRYHYIIHLLV